MLLFKYPIKADKKTTGSIKSNKLNTGLVWFFTNEYNMAITNQKHKLMRKRIILNTLIFIKPAILKINSPTLKDSFCITIKKRSWQRSFLRCRKNSVERTPSPEGAICRNPSLSLARACYITFNPELSEPTTTTDDGIQKKDRTEKQHGGLQLKL